MIAENADSPLLASRTNALGRDSELAPGWADGGIFANGYSATGVERVGVPGPLQTFRSCRAVTDVGPGRVKTFFAEHQWVQGEQFRSQIRLMWSTAARI